MMVNRPEREASDWVTINCPILAASAWALARIGARRLAYATPEFRITADIASEWLQTLLTLDWKQQPQLCFPAVAIARPTDESFTVTDDLRAQVRDKLRRGRRNEGWLRWLSEDAEQSGDQQQIWGAFHAHLPALAALSLYLQPQYRS